MTATDHPTATQMTLPGFDAGKERWEDAYRPPARRGDVVRNRSGIEIKPMYGPDDWDGSQLPRHARVPRRGAVHARHLSHDVPGAHGGRSAS